MYALHIAITVALSFAVLCEARGQDNGASSLDPGKSVRRELAGGQVQSYQIHIAAGQYLGVTVEQQGLNVFVTLFGPDGKLLEEFDSNSGTQGMEAISHVAEASGNHLLNVRARSKDAAGAYEIHIDKLRPATEKDRALLQARKLMMEIGSLNRAGRRDEARTAAERALTIRETHLSPDDPLITQSLYSLGSICIAQGDYARAERLLERALKVTEKLRGPSHPDVAFAANALGLACKLKGDHDKAEQYYLRSLAIREKAHKPDDPAIAQSLNNLASLYAEKSDYARAIPLYERALAIREKTLNPEDPDLLPPLNNLASVYQEMGDVDRAEPLYRRVLAISEKSLGAEHPNLAGTLNNLAMLTLLKGDYTSAEPMYTRALAIREEVLGLRHPLVAKTLDSFAVLYDLKGNIEQAVKLRNRGLEIREHQLGLILASGSEEQKQAFLSQSALSDEINITLSLHARSAPKNPEAAAMALNLILQRKGRVLDAMTDSLGAIRRRLDPQDRALLEQYASISARLAGLILSGQGSAGGLQYRAEVAKLEAERERLQAAISERSEGFGLQSRAVTLGRIQKLIPAGSALVEIATYQPFDRRARKVNERFGSVRYVAYVLRPEGPPAFVELGEAAAIDRAVARFRDALRDRKRTDVKRLARRVDRQVMQPVRALLGGTRRVLLSPDGALNLVPFAALVDERGRYLVSRYSFSYLTSGRDLLRLEAKQSSRQGPLVIADPEFGEAAADGSSTQRLLGLPAGARKPNEAATIDLSRVVFTPLRGTEGEARALKSLLPGATVLTRERATEAAVKQADGPRLLHIATHGFFLDDQFVSGNAQSINPLLRSGLGLAGANRRKSGPNQVDDGILTALEAASLNLQGTKLVVLSACDTGVGEVRAGDGVYGLRRALVLAGSETQVMSLWPVSDRATRDLMIEYYKRLQRGEGRGEALRRVQLMMLRRGAVGEDGAARLLTQSEQGGQPSAKPVSTRARKDFSHPYYWASFIPSGEWGNLDGKR